MNKTDLRSRPTEGRGQPDQGAEEQFKAGNDGQKTGADCEGSVDLQTNLRANFGSKQQLYTNSLPIASER